MKISQELDRKQDNYGEINVSMTGDEEEIMFIVIQNHCRLISNAARKRTANFSIVKSLTNYGSGYSCAICRFLEVDPYGYKWERNLKNDK